MKRLLLPLVFVLTLIAGITILISTPPILARAQNSNQQSSLTPQERRGKAIYERGESPSGKEITARVGEIDLPGSSMPCAICHGSRGEGLSEGGISSGGLRWSELTKANGHLHASGRKHKPFTEDSLVRATTSCVDPSGNKLQAAMPCYQLVQQDAGDLIAYLRRIESYAEPGVRDTSITVGVIIPTAGALTEAGAAMRATLTAYFEELSSRGGIHQRRFQLRFVDMTAEPTVTVANMKRLIESDQVFALIGGFTVGVEKESVSLSQTHQIPLIGPATLLPEEENARYVFYLVPGALEQSRALVNFAANRPDLKKSRLVIVYPDSGVPPRAADAIEIQATKLDWKNIGKYSYVSRGFVASSMVEKLKAEGAETLFFLGSGDEAAALLTEAAKIGWVPHVFMPGYTYSSTSITPKDFVDKVFLSFPSVPQDVTAAGYREYTSLREKYQLPERHRAAQLSALGAAKLFAFAVTKAGRDLTREKLVTALEGLSNFETDFGPKVTFGRERRSGARGAYIVALDVEKRTFSPNVIWVEAN